MIDSAIAIVVTVGGILALGILYDRIKTVIVGPNGVDVEFRHVHKKKITNI